MWDFEETEILYICIGPWCPMPVEIRLTYICVNWCYIFQQTIDRGLLSARKQQKKEKDQINHVERIHKA